MIGTIIHIDPEFAALIPPLSPDEYALLDASIRRDGCRDALVVWRGRLLDGHNRFEICQRHGIEFETVEMEFDDRDEAMVWIIDNQKGRRNISDIDRIALASRRESIVARQAKANQAAAADARRDDKGRLQPKSAKLPTQVNTRAASAKSAGVGERTYDAGKLILDAAEKGEIPAETIEDVRRGRAAIHRVAKDVKENRAKAKRDEQRSTAAASSPVLDSRILVGDFRDHANKIADGSVSLIFTDPPYDREASKMFPDLAKFAAEKLCDGGSIVFYLGHLQLPAAFAAFAAFDGMLRHWWTCACVHGGEKVLMREYGVRVQWKPMLWFVKGSRRDKSDIVVDVVSGEREKDAHPWQQAESEAAYWIEKLCPKDGLVCDPFLGGGTTGAAASKLGRDWIGIEIDKGQAAVASERIVA